MIVAIAFAFSTVIVDPFGEGAQLPLKTIRSLSDPETWRNGDLYVTVVCIKISGMSL